MAAPAELYDPAAFVGALPHAGPLVALDPGTRTLGVAISDTRWMLASPVRTIRRGRLAHDAGQLLALIEAEGVAGLVIGMPLNLDGTPGPRAQSVRGFRRELAGHIHLPMLFWDERLSSAEAADALRAGGASRRTREALVDAAAAAQILADALPALRAAAGRTG